MNKLLEKVTCKQCKNVEYLDIETINKETIKTSESNLAAVIVKKFTCKNCNSTEVDREYIKVKGESAVV